jgi:hypothetical protein
MAAELGCCREFTGERGKASQREKEEEVAS